MADLPASVGYMTVTGRLVLGYADSNDAGSLPDMAPGVGTVTFTQDIASTFPLVSIPDELMIASAAIKCALDANGEIVPPADGSESAPSATPGVNLIAPLQPGVLSNTEWTWTATFAPAAGQKWKGFSRTFTGAPGDVLNIATLVPVPASPGTEIAAWQAAVTTVRSGSVHVVDGRYYQAVGCVLRNNGGPDYFQPIEDIEHRSQNVDSVTTDGSFITLDYSSLGATRIVTGIAQPDETYAAAGFITGMSIDRDVARITISRNAAIADYVYYNGSQWISATGVFSDFTWNAGVLILRHAPMNGDADVQLTSRGGVYVPNLSGVGGAIDPPLCRIEFRDWNGTLVTTPDTNMKVFVRRGASGVTPVDPRPLDTTAWPLSNIWVYVLLEVAGP